MNLVLLGLGLAFILMSIFSGSRIDVASLLTIFKKDKESEIKTTVNDTKIADTTSSEQKIEEQIKEVPKEAGDQNKDEILKFWNKK